VLYMQETLLRPPKGWEEIFSFFHLFYLAHEIPITVIFLQLRISDLRRFVVALQNPATSGYFISVQSRMC
jgi:hypothetical protein